MPPEGIRSDPRPLPPLLHDLLRSILCIVKHENFSEQGNLGKNALGDRHDLCNRDGLARSRDRVLHPHAGQSDRALPGKSTADKWSVGRRGIVARGGHACHDRHGWLARGPHVARRAGYGAIAFGAWDIFYYVFLHFISGWPRTLLDWDILFLLPLPWWGPVLAPVSIALVMIVWGTLATQSGDRATDGRWPSALACVGILLALGVFMTDSWRALPNGREAVMQVLPLSFEWPVFWVAFLLIALPAIHHGALLLRQRSVFRRL